MDTSIKILEMMSELRSLIEERRKELNLSKCSLYEMTGYDNRAYSRFVEQGTDIQLSNFLRLCEALSIFICVDKLPNAQPYKDKPRGKLSHKSYKEKNGLK